MHKIKFTIVLLFLVLTGFAARAQQTEALGTFTPYSLFGIGELEKQGTSYNKGMGGIGIGVRDNRVINYTNPAAITARDTLSFMLDFGISQKNFYNTDGNVNSAFNTANMNNLMFTAPIKNKSAFIVGISPYSNIGYKFRENETNHEIVAKYGDIAYEKYGIEFRIDKSEDLKPHKKYYYAMQEFKDKNIVTVDDDVVYPPKMLERLYEAHLNNSHVICAGRVHRITFDENGRINEYDKWMHGDDLIKTPSAQLVPIGIGGVLYPPKTMNEKMFDIKSIKELCLKADDLWLKCSSCSVGTKVFAVCNASKYLYELEEAQSTALKKGNVNLKQNDIYFENAIKFFDLQNVSFKD